VGNILVEKKENKKGKKENIFSFIFESLVKTISQYSGNKKQKLVGKKTIFPGVESEMSREIDK
jgi:hypothetical protein